MTEPQQPPKNLNIERLAIEELDMEALLRAAVERCQDCIERCAAHLLVTVPSVEIAFNLRGRSAGQLKFQKVGRKRDFCLRFNASLFDRNRQAFFEEVIPHEVSHLFAYLAYGTAIKPHGKEWRYIMNEVFGLAARVTHDFEVLRQTRKLFNYACACDDKVHELTAIRHNRIQRNRANYRCRECEDILYEMVLES